MQYYPTLELETLRAKLAGRKLRTRDKAYIGEDSSEKGSQAINESSEPYNMSDQRDDKLVSDGDGIDHPQIIWGHHFMLYA